ncbi:MAG: hypothetical protein QW336_02635 [Candidatus Anstonellales archaeon]
MLIHEKNFIANLLNISTDIYELHLALKTISSSSHNPLVRLIAEELDNRLKKEYPKIISIYIKSYQHNDKCIGSNHRVLIIPITSIISIDMIRFSDGYIKYIGDGSLANPYILESIVEIDFDNGKLCISCKPGRFIVIGELTNREMGYFKILEGEFDLLSDCVSGSNRVLNRLDGILEIWDYLNFCE